MSLVEILAELVNIPSVTGDEDAIAAWIADRYETTHPVTRVGKSVVVGQPGERPFVALFGHTDTVPVQGEWKARIEDGRVLGLGTSDMKSGLAVMVQLLDDAPTDGLDLVCVFYDAEEGPLSGNGLGAVLDAIPETTEADLCIVLEPTDLKLEIGCNGAVNADVVFTGAPAHSARPWLGENAVTKAGAWLSAMHERTPEAYDLGGLVYHEVFSVTGAHGGIANNVIPGEFRLNLNYRFPPVFSIDEAIERLRSVAADADEVIVKDAAPAGAVAMDHPSVMRLDRLVARGATSKQGWTDVAQLTARGAVAVNYGPGEVAQAHKVDESVPIENLEIAHDVLRSFIVGA